MKQDGMKHTDKLIEEMTAFHQWVNTFFDEEQQHGRQQTRQATCVIKIVQILKSIVLQMEEKNDR